MPNSPKLALNPLWDEYSNNMFQMRLQVIDRFVCAGSKILLRVRNSSSVHSSAAVGLLMLMIHAGKELLIICKTIRSGLAKHDFSI